MLPLLTQSENAGVAVFTDDGLRAEHSVLIAFTLRSGGFSAPPFAGLNLAGHVGDDPDAVDRNRSALLDSLGVGFLRDRLTTAQQVHGRRIVEVGDAEAGAGARPSHGANPIEEADGLLTSGRDIPLLLLFADCVPVVLVATGPRLAVAVVHAGWRGALAGIVGDGALALAATAGCEASDLLAYVGPHIGPCHYEVDETLLSQFVHTFGTIAAAQGRLDLGAVVSESLNGVGVPISSVCRADSCTAERTDAFFSHRAEGLTGRHGALVCILGETR
jgi:YfiH family protein